MGSPTFDLGVLASLGGGAIGCTWWLGAELTEFDGPTGSIALVAGFSMLLWVGAAAWVIGRRPPVRATLVLVLLVAAVTRLLLVPGAPVLSDDIYRYVWDGRVQAAGINPYRYPPADPALAPLRDREIYPNLNRRESPTIYPPVAQGAFGLLYRAHASSVAWTKLAFVALDLVAVALLAGLLGLLGRRPELSLLYAWHPLAIFEIGGSGHVEVLGVLGLLAALHLALRGRALLAGVLLAGAGLVKFYALAALPAFAAGGRRLGLAIGVAATVVLAYLPFLDVGPRVLGYLPGYLEEEGFSSGYRFYLLGLFERLTGIEGAAPTALYVALAAACLAGLSLSAMRITPSPAALANRALLLLAAVLVLATPTYPWYALAVIALLPLGRGLVLLPAGAVALTAPLLYLHISVPDHPTWPRHLAYGTWAVALALAAGLAARRHGVPARALRPVEEAG